MKIKNVAIVAATTLTAALLQAVGSSAQAADLRGAGTCTSASFSYLECAGYFSGNDKGANGTGVSKLNEFFGSGWSFAGDNEDGLVTFTSGGDGTQAGSATSTLSGFGAIAIKAGNSYSLYTLSDLSSFNWDTAGVRLVGNGPNGGNQPALSHLSIYTQAGGGGNPSQDIPEPALLLGLVGLAGAGTKLRRR